MRIRFSPDARSYVKSEASYLRERSVLAAQSFSDNLKRLKLNLARFPKLGQASDELPVPGVFRFVMGDYLIDYEIRGDVIEVLAVRHGRQRPPDRLDDDFDFEAVEN
ncbi:plasmid stabilization protein ParE [Pararhizobium polonicum]|uniref:Plasmid stabilization protein ParE n=1 Tax=Pararhizobium polonicum TaxID=1612624 RepID=A0A1C7P449_9HYPH|nr:type II toxin-antitoxin system RelE/ParE family toxin [Pararhizobium polonicum]OBZ95999.1 plasmid stabilization protein ParE [Pararhizobium polonicum]